VPNISQPIDLQVLPAAPVGNAPVVFQADAPTTPPTTVIRKISGSTAPATATTPGVVPTPPNDATKFLNGKALWTVPPGSGGGTNDDVSFYLTPTGISPPALTVWAHQINGTHVTNNNGAEVLTTYGSTASVFDVIGEALAAGDFDLIMCGAMNQSLHGATTAYGLALWDSVSGKAVFFQVNPGAGVFITHYASFTSLASTPLSLSLAIGASVPIWFRINLSFGLYTFYLSVDGQSWDRLFQESATVYMPAVADHCGLIIYNSGSSTQLVNAVFPHFVIGSYVGS
jgi:hypothetical protein